MIGDDQMPVIQHLADKVGPRIRPVADDEKGRADVVFSQDREDRFRCRSIGAIVEGESDLSGGRRCRHGGFEPALSLDLFGRARASLGELGFARAANLGGLLEIAQPEKPSGAGDSLRVAGADARLHAASASAKPRDATVANAFPGMCQALDATWVEKGGHAVQVSLDS